MLASVQFPFHHSVMTVNTDQYWCPKISEAYYQQYTIILISWVASRFINSDQIQISWNVLISRLDRDTLACTSYKRPVMRRDLCSLNSATSVALIMGYGRRSQGVPISPTHIKYKCRELC